MEWIPRYHRSILKLMKLEKKTIVEQDRENRVSNIILYNVPEPKSIIKDERWKQDREFCLELFNKVLRVPIQEDDIKKFARLGKLDEQLKERPVLIQFKDQILKNMVMESVGKPRDADDKYKRIIFTHDMSTEDREEYKRLVADAKGRQENEISGEYIFRVKGFPGNFRVLKIKRGIEYYVFKCRLIINKKTELENLLKTFKSKPQIIALNEINYKN